jgi:hypothetical protein
LTIQAVTLPGTSLAQSDQLGRQLENILSAELDVSLKMQDRPK